MFSCLASNGKRIQVCDAGKTIDYSFGRPGAKPEIVVRAPRNEASTHQWRGIGRWMTYTASVPNGNTLYTVYWGFDRVDDKHPIEAGVNVDVNAKQVASVLCAPGKPVVQRMDGIDSRPM